ncbi:hypothetical protein DERF_001425 [Dermatophagoides farinae]|uniref:Uncharacterized protein n=1 Tax=Dermatophagoides farinae TaxID=6954 RepID=A0A922L9M1_DERFA|nr:hypothetical protein DERF_001425 [Dermatophagoides farinae]
MFTNQQQKHQPKFLGPYQHRKDLWEEDLRQFLDELDCVEQFEFEREQLDSGNNLKLKMKHSSKVSSYCGMSNSQK